MDGPVSLAVAGSKDWVQAGINRPLMPGDRLWVAAGARDEVQIGGAALRMDASTLVSVLNLDDRTAQFQLTQGRAYLRVRRLGPGEVLEVDTPNLALTIRRPGVYQLEVDPNGASTVVAVRGGQAEAYGEGNAYLIDPGQSYRFGGTNLQDYQYASAPPDDDFERWAAQRDQRHDRAVTRRYVSPELIGYEDLDDQGSWHTVPEYGSVWTPAHVAPDWAPYRDGHWSWIAPWGWTWVDDAPWGFTVSHYGRWTHLDAGWSWVPGPALEQPVYAPALVAFVAGAALALAADRGPGVAWFPLGPREVYRPAYQASPAYITKVNVSNTVINRSEINQVVNVTNVTNVNYANQQVPGAITAVPAQAFVRAQPVRQAALPVRWQALAAAPVTNKVALAPQALSRVMNRPARSTPSPAVMARQVIAHTPPVVPPMRDVAPPHPAARPATVALAATAPRVKLLPPFKPGRPLAPLPPPTKPAVATTPGAAQRAAGALPQAAPPPVVAGHAQVARPPEAAHSAQAAHPPQGGQLPAVAAQPPRSIPPQHAEPRPQAPPSQGQAQNLAQGPAQSPPARQARVEAPHPPEPARPAAQPPRELPHQLAQARPVAPPHPQSPAHPAPSHAVPPREVQHQPPQARAAEPPHPPPVHAEPPHAVPPREVQYQPPQARRAEPPHAPPEGHRPPPPPPPGAQQQHPASVKAADHHPPSEKARRKDEQQ
ncbi:FecR domain-containing protein [Duganella sp. FT3S]|uniref:FecR domain-containing protein n=1 Tax=Rugamonas fusca TaxID=2758568 RepID=A0A7W2I789_9BURK|nr:FecR domain-containing protein [Rugamonas fusca]